ncbi:MAG: DUF4056 domain-containing protein [Phycisphaerae bacterium]|nr:DUF4056 domain-containing protein [Phycisphaerae bacterium]
MDRKVKKPMLMVLAFALAAAMLAISGCTVTGSPRARLGCYATSTPGTRFIGEKGLGRHNYGNALFEGNGIAYTCRGGHIDVTHLRISADYTKYLYTQTRKHLLRNDKELNFKLNVEPSTYYVRLEYPPGWNLLDRKYKEQIAHDVALELSQHFAFTMSVWHEILTWFGFKTMAFIPEQPSAFSWEDLYSNLLGTIVAAKAIEDEGHSFDSAMTIALHRELEYLGIQSSKTAWQAAENMRGKWFTGNLFVEMKQRNFDIGIDDGLITPLIVPGICDDDDPISYPIPILDKFFRYGFNMTFEVEPKEWEKAQILNIVYRNGEKKKRLEPDKDIPTVVEYIRKRVKARGWNDGLTGGIPKTPLKVAQK